MTAGLNGEKITVIAVRLGKWYICNFCVFCDWEKGDIACLNGKEMTM